MATASQAKAIHDSEVMRAGGGVSADQSCDDISCPASADPFIEFENNRKK